MANVSAEAGPGSRYTQISGWNDSEGEPLALVFAQEHGAGLEAWRTRTRCETLTPLILVRIHVPQPGSRPQIAAYL